MSEIEATSLRRAALALLVLSVVRWLSVPRTVPVAPPEASALEALLDTTRKAAADAERRARPLQEGERLDPNTASAAELDRLPGVGPSTAASIVLARDTGLIFRVPDDLAAVRGIGARTVEDLVPFLALGSAPAGRAAGPGGPSVDASRPRARLRPRRPVEGRTAPIDLNRASAEELQTLPGVGPAIAARIVEARRTEPFRTLGDLTRVRGIGPATVSRLAGFAVVGRTVR